MPRVLDFHPKIKKDLEGLPLKHFRQVVLKCFDLMKNPDQNDTKALQGMKETFRVSSGEYRIVYQYTDETVYICAIGLRNDDAIYRDAMRRLQ